MSIMRIDTLLLICLAAAASDVKPTYLEGDFDGDGKRDRAEIVMRGKDQGITIHLSSYTTPVTLGAGNAFNDMKNLDFTAWQLHRKNKRIARGMGAGRPPVLLGDAFLLEWEGGSGIVYWNGKRFVWYQQGD